MIRRDRRAATNIIPQTMATSTGPRLWQMTREGGTQGKKTRQGLESNALWFKIAWKWDIRFNTLSHVFRCNWVSPTERACKANRVEHANEWAMRVNERADERVAWYSCFDSSLFWTIVERVKDYRRVRGGELEAVTISEFANAYDEWKEKLRKMLTTGDKETTTISVNGKIE